MFEDAQTRPAISGYWGTRQDAPRSRVCGAVHFPVSKRRLIG